MLKKSLSAYAYEQLTKWQKEEYKRLVDKFGKPRRITFEYWHPAPSVRLGVWFKNDVRVDIFDHQTIQHDIHFWYMDHIASLIGQGADDVGIEIEQIETVGQLKLACGLLFKELSKQKYARSLMSGDELMSPCKIIEDK